MYREETFPSDLVAFAGSHSCAGVNLIARVASTPVVSMTFFFRNFFYMLRVLFV